jgi:hypothetical protein
MLPHQLLITPNSFVKTKGKENENFKHDEKKVENCSFEFGELIREILIPFKTHPPPPPQSLFYKLLGPKPRVVPNGLDFLCLRM